MARQSRSILSKPQEIAMSFFDTHLSDCTPRNLCLKCKLLEEIRRKVHSIDADKLILLLDEVIDAHFAEMGISQKPPESAIPVEVSPKDPKLDIEIQDLGLSVRATTCLEKDNIMTIDDLIKKKPGDLLSIPGFGRKSLREIKEMLHSRDLALSDY